MKNLKILYFKGCFWPKYTMFELKGYRGVMFDDTEDWFKFEGKLTCAFKNDMKNMGNFRSQAEK